MFDLSKEPILTSLVLAAVASFTIGACWNGDTSDGLPCDNDQQCGLGKSCVNNYCAGVFNCSDGTQIDAADVCDVDIDCEDASDEDADLCGGGGANVNQCEEPDGDLTYRLGAAVTGTANAVKVVAADVQGMPSIDAISASQTGTEILIEFDLDAAEPKEFVLGPFGDRAVAGFEVADVNDDGKEDIIVFAVGSDIAIYVYQNMSPGPPQQFGIVGIVPDIPGYQPRGVEVGRLNDGNAADIVGIADVGPAHGVLVTALGDPAAAAGGGAYFLDPVQGGPIGYEQFVDSALADFDGDGLDDLVITGVDGGGPGLWFVHRLATDVGWADPIKIPVMSPGFLAVGRFTGSPAPGEPIGPRPDLAILDPMNGHIQTMVNAGGMLGPGFSTTLDGSGFTGLTIADMNCDGMGDFVFALTDPTEIHVLFGDGEGGARSNVPLVYADPGTPRGGLDVALLDQDSSPDIFTAADPGDDPMDEPTEPQIRVLVTGAP